MNLVRVEMSWPPSGNRRLAKSAKTKRMFLQKPYKVWKEAESLKVNSKRLKPFGDSVRLSVTLFAHEPNRIKRDLDNLFKAPLDVLRDAGVYGDDSQIDRLRAVRMGVQKPGKITITIEEV